MSAVLALLALTYAPQPFSFQGSFFEGCSCQDSCAFEMKGELPGCGAAGFYEFQKGEYGSESLAKTRVAFVAGSDGWIRLYIDGPNAKRKASAKKFIMTALKDWGKPEAVEYRPIALFHDGNNFTGLIDGGRTVNLKVEAQVDSSGDFTVHKNIFNTLLHPRIMQARTRQCRFMSGKRKMEFGPPNGFFHSDLKVSGAV